MTYHEATYQGDDVYSKRCTGDVCVGDEVRFERAVFGGSFRNASFEGFESITAKIIKDSYGSDKQQHTFTLLLADDTNMRIKGRNLYKNGTWRKPWNDESQRHIALDEKHVRGDIARAERDIRRECYA